MTRVPTAYRELREAMRQYCIAVAAEVGAFELGGALNGKGMQARFAMAEFVDDGLCDIEHEADRASLHRTDVEPMLDTYTDQVQDCLLEWMKVNPQDAEYAVEQMVERSLQPRRTRAGAGNLPKLIALTRRNMRHALTHYLRSQGSLR